MEKNNTRLMKLFDFILENKDISLDSELFSRDTLIEMRKIARSDEPKIFQLKYKQYEFLINYFINHDIVFDENTPDIFKEDKRCIKSSILKDPNSINFIQKTTPEIEKVIIDTVLKRNYILKEESLDYLNSNFNVALNSIKLDCKSADFVDWHKHLDGKIDKLIDEAIKHGYILDEDSCLFLRCNPKIALVSIKKDITSAKYLGESAKEDPKVFKYLILNGYEFHERDLMHACINVLSDYEVLSKTFEQIDLYESCDKKYIDRCNTLFHDFINSKPSIKKLDSVFETIAETKWKEFKNDRISDYENVFGKICSMLREKDNIDDAINELVILRQMSYVLDEKYDDLCSTMRKYFDIYHGRINKKQEKLEQYRDIISKLSALYIAKSKEDYKKEKIKECHEWLKNYFKLRLDHPLINKRMIQKQKRQMFKDMYESNDKEALEFINNIADKYSKNYSKYEVLRLIKRFLIKGICVLDSPEGYDEYERYEKALRLINRLNSGYIDYDGPEVHNYKDIIKQDSKTNCFIYCGPTFSNKIIEECNEFRKKVKLFENIKKDITQKASTIQINIDVDDDILEELKEELPFTDEYFELDDSILRDVDLTSLLNACYYNYDFSNIVDDEVYKIIYDLLINNNIMLLLILMKTYKDFSLLAKNGIIKSEIANIIERAKQMSDLNSALSLDTTKYDQIKLLSDISRCADSQALAILGKETIKKLYENQSYTNEDPENIIDIAKEFVSQMVKRNKSTVPFVSGTMLDYQYSIYDSQDISILFAGIDTDACFRIDGNDNDFFHYCALDKNGFVIKITDVFGNFIARASGFRNGNCVFINQLRTIHDEGGNFYRSGYKSEKEDIINVFKKACEDIVITSQNNTNEIDKIDYVFVTKSYILSEYECNIRDEVQNKIGENPMDTHSKDWEEFLKTKNLDTAPQYGYFDTDYSQYDIICIANYDKRKLLKHDDIKSKDVKALYERTRNKITIINQIDDNIVEKVNRIAGINSYLNETDFNQVMIPLNSLTILGDNFYIIYSNGNIINSCVLDFDKKAKLEYKAVLSVLSELAISDITQIKEVLKKQSKGFMKKLDCKLMQ